MAGRIYYRTIKNNRVKILGKVLGNKELKRGELDGKRFCFMPYDNIGNSGFSFDGLTALWGTETYSLGVQKGLSEEELKILGEESYRVLAPNGFLNWCFWKEVRR